MCIRDSLSSADGGKLRAATADLVGSPAAEDGPRRVGGGGGEMPAGGGRIEPQRLSLIHI